MAYSFNALKEKIKEIENWLIKEFASVRTSRATPSILDSVTVESYGSIVPINQVASITTEGARLIRIMPWDITLAKAIEKAIAASNLGLSVGIDDKSVRVTFPELTSERRQSLIKLAKQKLEEARVSLRKERDQTWDDIQNQEKAGGMGEDEKFRLKTEMQKLIDEAGKKFNDLTVRKEQEIGS